MVFMSTNPVQYHLGEFPPTSIDWARLIPLIGPANAGLARYDGLLSVIPNAHILLSPLTTQEAVISSKIEGTHVTMGELLEIEAGSDGEISQPKRDDAEEVFNYRRAMTACVKAMKHRPLSQHLLKTAHSFLMQGVRGQDQSPAITAPVKTILAPRDAPSTRPAMSRFPLTICKAVWMPGNNIPPAQRKWIS